MKKKLVRIPGIACPHCGSRAITRDSVHIDLLTRELRCVCDNDLCGHTMVVQLAVIRSIRLTDDPDEIDCRHDTIKGLVLRTEFVRTR